MSGFCKDIYPGKFPPCQKEAVAELSTLNHKITAVSLDDFVKEAKRFQSEGEKLGGVTLIDIIEHLHDFMIRKTKYET